MSTWVTSRNQPELVAHRVRGDYTLCRIPVVSRDWVEEPAWRRCASCTAITPGHVTAGDMVRLGLTYRQLDFWVRKGYLNPANARAGGKGTDRMFPPSEVMVAAEMARLVSAGLPPSLAHYAIYNDGELAPGVRVVVDVAA